MREIVILLLLGCLPFILPLYFNYRTKQMNKAAKRKGLLTKLDSEITNGLKLRVHELSRHHNPYDGKFSPSAYIGMTGIVEDRMNDSFVLNCGTSSLICSFLKGSKTQIFYERV